MASRKIVKTFGRAMKTIKLIYRYTGELLNNYRIIRGENHL
jgi:hypothetical protein